MYVNDLMPVLEWLVENTPQYKSYNVTPDTETELLQAAQLVKEISGEDVPVIVGKEGYGLNYSGSNARLHAEMPLLSFTPLTTAVKELYQYYLQNKSQLDKALLERDK